MQIRKEKVKTVKRLNYYNVRYFKINGGGLKKNSNS